MKVTGTGRSSTWFKGNIFQADSRKRVFFYAVPEKQFLLISSGWYSEDFLHKLCRSIKNTSNYTNGNVNIINMYMDIDISENDIIILDIS